MKLIIRDYKPEDFNAVDALWQATGLGGAIRGDSHRVILKTISLGGKMLILENEDKGEVAGTSWMTIDGRRIYLHHFGIALQYQGKGLSKMLLDASMQFAKSTGMQIKLEVHRDNKIASDIYKKAGFKYLGDYDVYIIRKYDEL